MGRKKSTQDDAVGGGSLLRLFQSEYFNIHLHMHYLFHRQEPGIHSYLVNTLYQRTDHEIDLYLPQIVQLALSRSTDLQRFVLDKSAMSMHFALKTSWLFQGAVEDKLPMMHEVAKFMYQEVEMAVVNSKSAVHRETIGKRRALDLFQRVRMGRLRERKRSLPKEPLEEVIHSADESDDVPEEFSKDEKTTSGWMSWWWGANEEKGKSYIKDVERRLGNPFVYSLFADSVNTIEVAMHHYILKQRRCDYFNTLHQFLNLIVEFSSKLSLEIDRQNRTNLLYQFVDVFNRWMFLRRLTVAASEALFTMTGLSIPMMSLGPEPEFMSTNLMITRVIPEECCVMSSKRRAPYLVVYEVCDLDEDLKFLPQSSMGDMDEDSDDVRDEEDVALTREMIQDARREKELKEKISVDTELLKSGEEQFKNEVLSRHLDTLEIPEGTTPVEEQINEQQPSYHRTGTISLWKHLYVYDCILNELQSVKQLKKRIRHILARGYDSAIDVLKEIFASRSEDILPASGYLEFSRPSSPVAPSVVYASPSLDMKDTDSASESYMSAWKGYSEDKKIRSAAQLRRALWGELWADKKRRYQEQSPYGSLRSWDLMAVMVKSGDDLRQELIATQLIQQFSTIFKAAKIPLWLRPYEILVTGNSSGIMEFLYDTVTFHKMKHVFSQGVGCPLSHVFNAVFADIIYEAKKNFIESHAAYSVVAYILQIKDRHNGNIMMDPKGHTIHIDFGYMLTNSPGFVKFETSPFKLSQEILDIMDGYDSDNFHYFCSLVRRGFLEVRKHADRIIQPVELMLSATKMPCFSSSPEASLTQLKDRLMLSLPEEQCVSKIDELILTSVKNWTTDRYDQFQRFTNGIL